jgi:hypothetical protein
MDWQAPRGFEPKRINAEGLPLLRVLHDRCVSWIWLLRLLRPIAAGGTLAEVRQKVVGQEYSECGVRFSGVIVLPPIVPPCGPRTDCGGNMGLVTAPRGGLAEIALAGGLPVADGG